MSVFALWLPILVAAVLVFVVSSVLHMVLPIHKGDMKKLPDEDGFMAALGGQNPAPNEYAFPCPGSMKEMGSPEFLAKYERGPVGYMVVMPPGPAGTKMNKSLLQWLVLCLVIGFFVAYLAALALPAGAGYASVFRFTATAAFLGYSFGSVSNSIWKGVPWSTTAKFVFDGALYALVTAGTFGWLWPAAA